MAKQSGLHQIRGKVGEHSYYKQSGVASGLIRSINQGMSSRVKTAAEYENTRLNNAEFGQAGRIAGVLGKLVTPKYRPMILPFSQSKMAKSVLEVIKTKTGNWGQRNLSATDDSVLVESLNLVHKNDPSYWNLSMYINSNDQLVVSTPETTFPSLLSAIGADGVLLRLAACRPWIGTYSQDDDKYAQSFARANFYTAEFEADVTTVNFDYEFRPAPPTGWPATYCDFFVLTLMPFRTINNEQHILQEYCTFIAFEMPESE